MRFVKAMQVVGVLTATAAIGVLAAPSASAQSGALTPQQFRDIRSQVTETPMVSLEVQEYNFSGELGGCGLVFNVVVRDWAHAPEAVTYAVGSVSYFAKRDEPMYLATKLVIDDVREVDGGVSMFPARATFSYLRNPSESLSGQEARIIFDEEGSSLLGLYPDPDASLMGFLATPQITFAYNRGGPDIEFALNTMDGDHGQTLSACMFKLISAVRSRVE